MKRRFTREQRTVVIYGILGILGIIVLIVVLQLWLLTATMNAYLGGDASVIWPAAGVSAVCLGLNVGLSGISTPWSGPDGRSEPLRRR